jgi:outer membrane protein OmpA-like peptidoglycan-associated protein
MQPFLLFIERFSNVGTFITEYLQIHILHYFLLPCRQSFKKLFNMRTFIHLFIMVLLLPAVLSGQSLSTNNKRAIGYFNEGRMKYEYRKNDDAYLMLVKAVEQDENFYEARLLLGDVCNDLRKYDEALTHYNKAILINPNRFPAAFYNLAGVEMELGKYNEAIQHMQQFLGNKSISKDLRTKGERRFANAVFAQNAVANPVPFTPVNLGSGVNSIYNDYHPSLTVDENTLIFTRMRPADAETDNGGSQFEEDFYISRRENLVWGAAVPLGAPLNTHGNEGAHSVSPDGRYFYFTGCERPEGYGSCDLYLSRREGDKWSRPVNMGELINSGTWDAQPTIGPDGRTLVFTSRRAGGKGLADLWITHKRDNGTWTLPENLGDSINTPYDEFGPYLHPDGRTLFFSSEGHPGMGGKDIFYSRLKPDGTWSKPVNLGYPINTKNDELHMIVSPDGKKGYFSSDREGGTGLRDLYVFDLYEAARPQAVTYMRGKIRDAKTMNPVAADVGVIDVETGEVRATTQSDKQNGEFLISLPSGSSYAVNAEAAGYLFFSGNYTIGKELTAKDEYKVDILLSPVEAGSKIVLNNIFFEFGKANLLSQSKVELDKVFKFLEKNPTVRVEIGGHTDDVGDDASNQALSEKRAAAVVEHLVKLGVDAARLESKGYGEKMPLATNATETGRAINRRTEFKILPAK